MKEVKAYVHKQRIAEVIQALKEAGHCGVSDQSGCRNLTVYEVKGSMRAVDSRETHYSIELAAEVIHEYKLELICEDDQVEELVTIIQSAARTGQAQAGWIYVVDVDSATAID